MLTTLSLPSTPRTPGPTSPNTGGIASVTATEEKKKKVRDKAIQAYKNELFTPEKFDLGLHGVTRASLRVLCQESVLEASVSIKRKYSYSAISSNQSLREDNNVMSALRQLQKERLIVSRLGFPEKAFELDQQIENMRATVKVEREKEEMKLLEHRTKLLGIAQNKKWIRLDYILNAETEELHARLKAEENKLLKKQEVEFIRALEGASRRAVGKVKKCNCTKPYLCKHNKTASYNTRKPTHTGTLLSLLLLLLLLLLLPSLLLLLLLLLLPPLLTPTLLLVIQYRRNASRLRHAGRPEESLAWEDKAKEIDDIEQEAWRKRVSNSIVASPWGANEAVVDQLTEKHKKDLQILRKSHAFKIDLHNKQHEVRRRNFKNTITAEVRKVKMQCRKQAIMKIQKDENNNDMNSDADESDDEVERRVAELQRNVNLSRNIQGDLMTDSEKKDLGWTPPTQFGLDNSVAILDVYKQIQSQGVAQGVSQMEGDKMNRIFTTKQDIKSGDIDDINKKLRQSLNIASTSEDEYVLGETSGSKLMDRLRRDADERNQINQPGVGNQMSNQLGGSQMSNQLRGSQMSSQLGGNQMSSQMSSQLGGGNQMSSQLGGSQMSSQLGGSQMSSQLGGNQMSNQLGGGGGFNGFSAMSPAGPMTSSSLNGWMGGQPSPAMSMPSMNQFGNQFNNQMGNPMLSQSYPGPSNTQQQQQPVTAPHSPPPSSASFRAGRNVSENGIGAGSLPVTDDATKYNNEYQYEDEGMVNIDDDNSIASNDDDIGSV